MKYLIVLAITIFSFSTSKAQCNVKVLEAFGGISSVTLYNTYLSIGALADAYVNEVYDADYIQTLMNEQITMIDHVSEMLSLAHEDGGLSEEDKAFIMDLITGLIALQYEAEGLRDFAATGSEEAQDRYNDYREIAWKYIKVILDLE